MGKRGMETYRPEVERSCIFSDKEHGHVFTRGPMIGKGGFGFVYETTMPGYTRRLVLKAIPKARVTKPNQRQRIQNEITLHKKLDHNNIVKLYHAFEEDHVICMIIERCERSLLDLLQEQNKQVDPQDVSIVARQVLHALDYLHAMHVIHRDLKLGNILLKNNLLVKLCDFGLAKYHNPDDKPTICGTPNYLAPEVLLNKGHIPESDIWSLGCVLAVLLTGHAPFEGNSTEETYELIVNSEINLQKKVTTQVENFLIGVLQKDVPKRFTIKQALDHPFIQKYIQISPQPENIINDENVNPQGQNNNTKNKNWTPQKQPLLPRITNNGQHSGNIFKRIMNNTKSTKSKEGFSTLESGFSEYLPSNEKQIYEDLSVIADLDENAFVEPTSSAGTQLWIQCWIDYSNKDCGFAYRLSNDTIGVKLKADKISYILKRAINRQCESFKYEYYSDSRNKLTEFTALTPVMEDKFKKHVDEMKGLVDYYDDYMTQNLINAGNMPSHPQNNICKIRLLDWYKEKNYVAMVLTNYTVQVNFFASHNKIVMQGLFNEMNGMNMPIPQTPSKATMSNILSVIPMSEHDVKQNFRILFVNKKRRFFQLDTNLVLQLIVYGAKSFPLHSTKALDCTPEELLNLLDVMHKAMHNLSCFSSKCYTESFICTAFKSQKKSTGKVKL